MFSDYYDVVLTSVSARYNFGNGLSLGANVVGWDGDRAVSVVLSKSFGIGQAFKQRSWQQFTYGN